MDAISLDSAAPSPPEAGAPRATGTFEGLLALLFAGAHAPLPMSVPPSPVPQDGDIRGIGAEETPAVAPTRLPRAAATHGAGAAPSMAIAAGEAGKAAILAPTVGAAPTSGIEGPEDGPGIPVPGAARSVGSDLPEAALQDTGSPASPAPFAKAGGAIPSGQSGADGAGVAAASASHPATNAPPHGSRMEVAAPHAPPASPAHARRPAGDGQPRGPAGAGTGGMPTLFAPSPSATAPSTPAATAVRPHDGSPAHTPPLASDAGADRRAAERNGDPSVPVEPAPAAGGAGSAAGADGTVRQAAAGQAHLTARPAPAQPVPLSGLGPVILRAAVQGEQRLLVRIEPPALGQVEIGLRLDPRGRLEVTLRPRRAEALERLREEIPALERLLGAQSAGDAHVRLELASDDGQAHEREQPARPFPAARHGGAFLRVLEGLVDVKI